MKVAVCGVTGLVGTKMCQILEERAFPVSEFYPVASEKSVGKEILWKGKSTKVISMENAVSLKPDIALFSAGGNVSLEWAEKFAAVGTVVIDNSSAWRMGENIPLIVPEVNAGVIQEKDKIIANPNCSTIQLVVVLSPLHKEYNIKRIIISTYQSVTGTGKKAVTQLENERNGIKGEMAYHHPIDLNLIPQIDVFTDNGYSKEEIKIINETKKIMSAPEIKITATAVRVPVLGGHSESVNIEFEKDFDLKEIRQILQQAPGVVIIDDLDTYSYPMPKYSHEKDEVFVGRIRRDESNKNSLNLWIVSDNLRKGAATNAIQIAEYLIQQKYIKN